MFKVSRLLLLLLLVSASISSCAKEEVVPDAESPATPDQPQQVDQNIVISPAEHGPEYPQARLSIVSPREGQVFPNANDSVYVIMNVTGMDIAKPTQGDTTKGINYSKEGQHVHIIIDDKPYMANYKNGQPFNVGVLSAGMHTVRAFPSRSWHESVKVPAAFAMKSFSVGDGKEQTQAHDPKSPLLTYSRPKGNYSFEKDKKILLDFFLTNAKLGEDDVKVKVSVNGKAVDTLTEWRPYYLEGFIKGTHTVELQLLNRENAPVPGKFNTSSGQITIE